MKSQTPFKRLILRAVLRKVSPMIIRVLALPDYLTLAEFTKFSAPFSAGRESGSVFTSTARNSLVFSAGRRCSGKRFVTFNCAPERHFSIHVEDSIFGNGSSGFWTRNQEVAAMRRRCAWQAVVRLHPNAAVAPRVIG